jgi:hypothetical protein
MPSNCKPPLRRKNAIAPLFILFCICLPLLSYCFAYQISHFIFFSHLILSHFLLLTDYYMVYLFYYFILFYFILFYFVYA